MHEQLLYGQVPAVRHEQLLSILAGITAMQPQRVIERRALYKPIKNVSSNLIQRGGTQGIQNPQKSVPSQRQNDLHYLHLIKSVEEKDFGQTVNVTTSYDVAVQGRKEPRKPWRFELQDTPELGKRPVGFRYAHLTDIIGGDPHKFMVDFGYRYVDEFVIEGHRFVLNNTVLLLHRILRYPTANPDPNLRCSLPNFNELKPLDPSGAYILEAKIRLSDGSNASLVNVGQQELERFQNRMKGVVELKAPDRLALDTRVK